MSRNPVHLAWTSVRAADLTLSFGEKAILSDVSASI
jgi:hypothetical protein